MADFDYRKWLDKKQRDHEASATQGSNEKALRFIAITHNPITMARMDRLFGVTQSERGVSQLVSVELEQAEKLLEAS